MNATFEVREDLQERVIAEAERIGVSPGRLLELFIERGLEDLPGIDDRATPGPRTPALKAETPALKAETPALKAETPALKAETQGEFVEPRAGFVEPQGLERE